MINIQIKPCLKQDINKIMEIENLCFSEEFRYKKEIYLNLLNVNNITSLKVVFNKKIVGFLFYQEIKNRIITINIHPDYRKMGIATFLFKILENLENKISSNREMTIHVYEKNIPAIKFWEKMGFRKEYDVFDYYGEDLDACFMKKKRS